MVICLIYFLMFHSVFLNEIKIETYSKPSFRLKDIINNMASSFMFENKMLEKSEKTGRKACYHSLCIKKQKPIPGQRSDSFKRLWYSYAF